MRKTLKKALIVMAIIATLVLVMAFSASAVQNCGEGNHITATRTVEATCTTEGYTETYCTVCSAVIGKGSFVNPYGHDYTGVATQYDAEGDYYKKGHTCNRCKVTIYEFDGENVAKYYRVELVNPWATATYEDLGYTKLAATYKDQTVKDGEWYIKGGETYLSYIQKLGYDDYITWMRNKIMYENLALRYKDRSFGEYKIAGWTYAPADSADLAAVTFVDFNEEVNANTKIYAAFEGNTEVFYYVEYINADGEQFTTNFTVRHGQDADDSIFLPTEVDGEIVYLNEKLTYPENAKYYYEFAGWSIDRTAIYGNVTISAVYDAILKEYDYQIYVWDESAKDYVPAKNGDAYVTATATYGEPLVYSGLEGTTIDEIAKRETDRTYIYSWTGDWQILETGFSVSSSSSTAPYGVADTRYRDDEGYEPIKLIGVYNRRLNLYQTVVRIKFDQSVDFTGINKNYEIETYLNGITVQVADANGALITTGTAYLVPGTDYAELQCSLYDSSSYTVTAVTYRGKYSGSTTINRGFVYSPDATVYISVGLINDPGYAEGLACNCICHNALFKPIWVRILNLLYRFFNVKHVCCDDMYATIGDLLVYTKD